MSNATSVEKILGNAKSTKQLRFSTLKTVPDVKVLQAESLLPGLTLESAVDHPVKTNRNGFNQIIYLDGKKSF